MLSSVVVGRPKRCISTTIQNQYDPWVLFVSMSYRKDGCSWCSQVSPTSESTCLAANYPILLPAVVSPGRPPGGDLRRNSGSTLLLLFDGPHTIATHRCQDGHGRCSHAWIFLSALPPKDQRGPSVGICIKFNVTLRIVRQHVKNPPSTGIRAVGILPMLPSFSSQMSKSSSPPRSHFWGLCEQSRSVDACQEPTEMADFKCSNRQS